MAIEMVDLPMKHGEFSIVMWLFTRGYIHLGSLELHGTKQLDHGRYAWLSP
jgi:predicted AlkP superfamily phosphohydrolase/phosphomutase